MPSRRSRSPTSSVRSAMPCSSSPVRTGSAGESAQLPGRLLHGGRRSRSITRRCRHQRVGLRAESVHRERLRGAQQLLALALEPDHQRHHPELRLLHRRVLGGVAGGPDAPGPRQRANDADGLLHRAVVRERRVHRGLAVHGDDHQRIAAAVARPQQRSRRLDERCLEPGLLRRPRRAGAVVPEAAVYDTRDEPGHSRGAVPLRRRRRRVPHLRAVGADELGRNDVGLRSDARPVGRDGGHLRRAPGRQGEGPSTARSPRARASSSRPASTRSTGRSR